MNTPAHTIFNLTLLGKKSKWKYGWPIIIGSFIPDSTMFLFYFYQKWIARTPERIIWNEKYFEPAWQAFFDIFNSLPITLPLFCIALWRKWYVVQWICASILLHIAFDLPLHHDDGHHHFYPFSDYQFVSPISYWDPDHYGLIVGSIELALTLLMGMYCLRMYKQRSIRFVLIVFLGLYVALLAFFFWMFG